MLLLASILNRSQSAGSIGPRPIRGGLGRRVVDGLHGPLGVLEGSHLGGCEEVGLTTKGSQKQRYVMI